MSRARSTLLSAITIALFAVVLASSASAAQFIWSVNGTSLASGQTLSVLVKSDGTIILTVTVFGVSTQLLSNTVSSTNSVITGGLPGGGSGRVTFSNIKVDKPANCTAANVTTNQLTSTIVAAGASTTGTALVLIAPTTGTVFATLTYGGSSCSLNGDSINVTGSLLLQPLSTTSQELQLFTFLPNGTQGTTATGTTFTSNFQVASNKVSTASIAGNVGLLLDVALPFSAL